MKVHFTETASEQLDGIYSYIAKDSPHYAQRVVERIIRRANNAGTMPKAAGVVREFGRSDIREVFAYRYRIIYRILADRIDVLAIIHGARLLPEQVEDLEDFE